MMKTLTIYSIKDMLSYLTGQRRCEREVYMQFGDFQKIKTILKENINHLAYHNREPFLTLVVYHYTLITTEDL